MIIHTKASAPGKVILFGEHAVVYGITAVAASLSDLRIFVNMEVDFNKEKILLAIFDDIIDPITNSPTEISIHLDKIKTILSNSSDEINPSTQTQELLQSQFNQHPTSISQGLMAISYLIHKMILIPLQPLGLLIQFGIKVSIQSDGLPIGVGLGSSAAFSVALAGACYQMKESLKTAHSKVKSVEHLPNPPTSFSHQYITPSHDILNIINDWAYASEILIHGTPSGLDNTTSCFGGLVKFSKFSEIKFENISKVPSFHILLTNTKVPRSTKQLVASVRELHDIIPEVVDPIFQSIENISQTFLSIIKELDGSNEESIETGTKRQKFYKQMTSLFKINHHLLNSLGVGHPALSHVYSIGEENEWKLATKLTGAGGGGCAITLLPFEDTHTKESNQFDVEPLKEKLRSFGYEIFESAVAGDGVRFYPVV